MTEPPKTDALLADHDAWFRNLLPGIEGVLYHGVRGRLLWTSLAPEILLAVVGERYRQQLRDVLQGEKPLAAAALLRLGDHVAWLTPLRSGDEQPLGVLALVLPAAEAPVMAAALQKQLAPALRNLQQVLWLRRQLIQSQRRLRLQAAEGKLLHAVEDLFHGPVSAAEQALQELLFLCRRHLAVDAAWLAVPDKQILLADGYADGRLVPPTTVARLMGLGVEGSGEGDHFVGQEAGVLWIVLRSPDRQMQGVLVLEGWQQSPFSRCHLGRILGYIAPHAESLLNKNYDSLTGLRAWPWFEGELAAAAARDGSVLMVMDIDRLHVFNETFGRETGDVVLRQLATVLREALPMGAAARVTGDQFAVLLQDADLGKAQQLGEDICRRFKEHAFTRDGQTYRASVSIGISPLDAVSDSDAGMGAARAALQAAKDRGRGRVEIYQSADISLVQRVGDLQMLGHVRSAIENNRLTLMAQPLAPLRDGGARHYHEVLVRILDEEGGQVAPGEFMATAERFQLMEELDRWVVQTTLRLLARHGRHLRGPSVRFAINLSGQSLGSRQFLHFVERAVRSSGVPPGLIIFEITESVAVSKMQQAQAFMLAMRALGCRFSLDDFGTGLSSFAYLKLFPVDTLKIDGSFVQDLASNVVSQSVVAAIAEVARVLKLETVAEFVGDEVSMDLLRRLNIGYAQGFFVGRGVALAEQVKALERRYAARATSDHGISPRRLPLSR